MNAAHLHLVTNHLPVVGVPFALLLLAWGMWRRSAELIRTACGAFVILTLLTFPAYFSGEQAAGVLGAPPDADLTIIQRHDDTAAWAFTALFVAGVTALAGLIGFRKRESVPVWFSLTVFMLGLVTAVFLIWTANLGGKIRHSEIRQQR